MCGKPGLCTMLGPDIGSQMLWASLYYCIPPPPPPLKVSVASPVEIQAEGAWLGAVVVWLWR